MSKARYFARTGLLLAALGLCNVAQAGWVASWTAAPAPPAPALGRMSASVAFENRTLRQILRLSAGGNAVRVRFSNAYGAAPLVIGAARIAMLDASGQEVPDSSRTLSFGGAPGATAARTAPLLSDAVTLKVPPLSRLAVSVYLPGDTGLCTCHPNGLDDTEISTPGDFTAAPFKPESVSSARAFLAAVEVDAAANAATVVVIGDSITDGTGSTSKANHRWPDFFAERLVHRGGRSWAVANQGIAGNRVLGDGMGESALARLDRDVFSLPGVKALIVFEGVNDLGMSFGHFEGPIADLLKSMPNRQITAAQMLTGYRQLVARAHALGIKVYGSTIAPYKGAIYWSEEGEAARQEINQFIRSSGVFDAVIDFDHALSDPAEPFAMRAGYHMGDHLHGNDAGYQAMADAIDLKLFPR